MKKLLTNKAKKGRGFTLIELLVVIGIIGILAAIVIIAVNPGRQFEQARDAQRWNDVNAILNGIHQYAVDNNGLIPADIPTTAGTVASTDVDLCDELVDDYLSDLPIDPSTGTKAGTTACEAAYDTGYTVVKDATSGRITIDAPDKEQASSISVTR